MAFTIKKIPWKQLAQNALARLGYRLINTRTHFSHNGLHFLSDPAFQTAYPYGVAASHGHDHKNPLARPRRPLGRPPNPSHAASSSSIP